MAQSWLSFSSMAGYDPESERQWDEYQWERFLQQQDEKTEKYMELLEKYLDHPDRDQLIAREMGWTQLLADEEWTDDIESEIEADATTSSPLSAASESFEENGLYQAAFALTVWIDQLFDSNPALQNEPAAVKLATHAALASAKLAAALSDDDVDELGMTIAYLKRGLKAITTSMDAAVQLEAQKLISHRQHAAVQQRLFQVRDGIVTLMGEYRGEWLRRFGSL
ncbi:MAG: hypothetical protein ACJ8JD_08350 [Chthoniobacterales bacterium]|jgi:Trp operon repressor